MKRAAILLLLAVLLPRASGAADHVEGMAFVIDGDTIEIQDERIRLWGIDAPEIAQRCTEDGASYPCGLDSSQELRKRIGRKPVSCVRRDTDRYGRMVALCTVADIDISRWMVQQGQAIAFRRYSLDYVEDEDAARAAKVGIWAGEFQDPSEFRHQSRRQMPRAGRRPCACPEDMDRAGRRCGRRSGFTRPGGGESHCTLSH
jgi:endonuclease YncB( thermonuclease family)